MKYPDLASLGGIPCLFFCREVLSQASFPSFPSIFEVRLVRTIFAFSVVLLALYRIEQGREDQGWVHLAQAAVFWCVLHTIGLEVVIFAHFWGIFLN